MKDQCNQNLEELKGLLINLSSDQYCCKSKLLSDSSLGQHTRHIIEFYLCLLNGFKTKVINYDARKRDIRLETDLTFSIFSINKIQAELLLLEQEADILLDGCYGIAEIENVKVKSSVKREMIYCLEHSIHHMALIKVGLHELGCADLIPADFGVASSTVRFNENACVQ